MKCSRLSAKAAAVPGRVDGLSYDEGLIALAEGFAKDGQISFAECRQLWDRALDGQDEVGEVQRRSLQWALEAFTFTDKAAALLETLLEGAKPRSHFKQMGGVKFDR